MTFNDHDGSTKSYGYMKDHEMALHELDFVPFFEDIAIEIPEGMSPMSASTMAPICASANSTAISIRPTGWPL